MINYSKNIFSKDLDEITYEDIVFFFISEKIETNLMEFKSYSSSEGTFDKNLNKVIRAITSFLNSDGGIIIWGSPKGITNGNIKKFIGSLSPVNVLKDKDWIINKIAGNILPLPIGIRVNILGNQNNGYVYIFEVQPSDIKPHQFENIYPIRLDGQTKPAPHYLIEALFKQIKYPNIEFYLNFLNVNITQTSDIYWFEIIIGAFNFTPLQNEENIIYRLMSNYGRFTIGDGGNVNPYDNSIGLLHFGTPYTQKLRLYCTPEELNNLDEIVLILSFGGKSSPAKSSEYRLSLSRLNKKTPRLNQIEIKKNENEFIHDIQNRLGTTKEITLQSFYNLFKFI